MYEAREYLQYNSTPQVFCSSLSSLHQTFLLLRYCVGFRYLFGLRVYFNFLSDSKVLQV